MPEPYVRQEFINHPSPIRARAQLIHCNNTYQSGLRVFTQLVLLRALRNILAGLEGARLAAVTIDGPSAARRAPCTVLPHRLKNADMFKGREWDEQGQLTAEKPQEGRRGADGGASRWKPRGAQIGAPSRSNLPLLLQLNDACSVNHYTFLLLLNFRSQTS